MSGGGDFGARESAHSHEQKLHELSVVKELAPVSELYTTGHVILDESAKRVAARNESTSERGKDDGK
jgi:hypothetical protein